MRELRGFNGTYPFVVDDMCVYDVEACVSVEQTPRWSQGVRLDTDRDVKIVSELRAESNVRRKSICNDFHVN